MKIRPYRITDYPAVVAIRNAIETDHPISVEAFQRVYEARDPKCIYQMMVAEKDGALAGFALYTQYADMYQPGVFWGKIYVLPKHRRRGVGTALVNTLMNDLTAHHPRQVKAQVREDNLPTMQFAIKHGFKEGVRRWESQLDVQSANLSEWAEDVLRKVANQGIVLKSLAELAGDPQRDEKFYELHWLVDRDVPMEDDGITKVTMAQFRKNTLENPEFLLDGTFVALDGDVYIGLTTFFRDEANNLHIDLTGVLREYRRRNIATALKLRAIQFARAQGYSTLVAFNDAPNVGMLAINERLGFVRQPAWLIMKKLFG